MDEKSRFIIIIIRIIINGLNDKPETIKNLNYQVDEIEKIVKSLSESNKTLVEENIQLQKKLKFLSKGEENRSFETPKDRSIWKSNEFPDEVEKLLLTAINWWDILIDKVWSGKYSCIPDIDKAHIVIFNFFFYYYYILEKN